MTQATSNGDHQGTRQSTQPLQLLVVDDDVLGRSMMEILLSPEGYRLDFACDGAEALQAIKSRSYDLVFMDLVLPDMNGRDVCREVRQWEGGKRHVPIVAVTAYDLPGQPLELIKAGMDDYLFKPYDLRGLTRMIRLYAVGDDTASVGASGMPTSAPAGDSPVLDIAGSLEDFSNDAASYRELLSDFLDSLPSRLEKMRAAQQESDMDRLGRECHSLKGISAGLGALRLSRLSGQLSGILRERGPASTPEILRQIEQGMDELRSEAKIYLAS